MAPSASKWSTMEHGIYTYTSKPSAYAGSKKNGASVITYTKTHLMSGIRLARSNKKVVVACFATTI